MTDDKLYTSLSANTIMAKVTYHLFITSSTDKHYSLDSEDDFRSGCQNFSHQQQFFSELHLPGRSHYTNKWRLFLMYEVYLVMLTAQAALQEFSSCMKTSTPRTL